MNENTGGAPASAPESYFDELNSSFFDELIEIDLIYDRCRILCHTEGKYFAPMRSGAFSELYRYCQEHMVHPDDRETYRRMMEPDTLLERLARAERPGVLREEIRYKLLDGNWCWMDQIVLGGAQHGFGEGLVRIYMYNVQEKENPQRSQTIRSRAADMDELTGLLRQRAFFLEAQELIQNREADWCMLSVDIENFRLFNEWYGHETGDLLLAQVGALFKKTADRVGGLAGYLGQDDYCMLLPYDKKNIDRLFDEIHELIVSRGTSMGFMPAFGISYVDDADDITAALDRSSIAAGQIKGDYHTRIRFYQHSMQNQAELEYRVLSDFQRGLKNHELFFCLQPQCVAVTGKVVGAESLARWKTPDGRLMPPDEFVPVLEKYGFITDLDKYIWENVCAWLHRWIRDGHTPVPVSLNVSQADFFAIDVPAYFERLTEKYGIPRELIKIEITESAYVDNTDFIRDAVQALRDKGFLTLMDDFGSGYSSLNMLHKLNVDVIKLDAQFLDINRSDETKGIHIIETIVNMTRTMAVPIIVEGVESAEQLSFLEKLGCRYIQGFYFYRPLSVAEFEELIGDVEHIDPQGFSFISSQPFSVREFMDENIYSDSMLNNILGAAAFYCWDGGENVDIVRYNEQFMRMVNVPDFHDRLIGMQQYVFPSDRQLFLDLLRKAEEDRFNGSEGVFGVYRTDGSLGQFFERFYFLEETESGKIFYGAMQEVTEIAELRKQMRMFAQYSSESIVFLQRQGSLWYYQVVVHGLESTLGLTAQEFERELNEGGFYDRLEADAARKLISVTMNMPKDSVGLSFSIQGAEGKNVGMHMKIDHVTDPAEDVRYILIFRLAEGA